jgi:hypothetical protein
MNDKTKEILQKFVDGEKLYKENAYFKMAVDKLADDGNVYHLLQAMCIAYKMQINETAELAYKLLNSDK